MTDQLPEGCDAGLPAPLQAAWGAWLVVHRSGYVDPVPDRHGFRGESAALRRWLNAGAYEKAVDALAWRLRAGDLQPPARIVLLEDGEGIVVATVSALYARLSAWRHDEVGAGAAA